MTIKIPGKLFISGEYAVLYGTHAVLAPVERTLSFECKAGRFDTLVTSFYGTLNLENDPNTPKTIQNAYTIALDYLKLKGIVRNRVIITVKSALDQEGQKLGLGSSGALTVGIIRSILEFHGVTLEKDRLFKLAVLSQTDLADHASFGDIAVAVYKSWILYRRFDETVLKKRKASPLEAGIHEPWPGLVIQPFQPARFYAFAVNSLEPASSKALVQAFTENFDRKSNASLINTMDQMSLRLYNELASPMIKTDTVDALEHMYEKIMHAGMLNLKTASLDSLIETIQSFHGSAKISGAGGGDCVLAFFDDETAYHDALEYFKQTQYPIIHLRRSR